MEYNPVNLEKHILEFWEKNKLSKKIVGRKGKTFSFMDGPPTANNPMGVHHAWGRTYKDLYLRLKSMQGFEERRQPGFDCQGLWVEVGVEKELGFKSKKDIEDYGLDKFTEKCKSTVLNYVKIWTDLSKKLGMWMDWDKPYLTMTDKNIEYVWHFLKNVWKKGWLYKGLKSTPWCPRCGTSLSSHEVASGYKEITQNTVFLKLPIIGREREYLLIWTTTPWTLPSNVAVAVHSKLEYVKVKQRDGIFYLAKSLLRILDGEYEILEGLNGKKLEGLRYETPFSQLPMQNFDHKVFIWDLVSGGEGTGLVHIAPGAGPEDFEFGREHKLPIISLIDENGRFIENTGWLEGKTAKESNELIIARLEKTGFVYKTEKYKHNYPHCWRCGEELLFRTSEEWFIKTEKIRPSLIREAKKVKWYPEWTEKSMLDWLQNLKDWNISRKRYYGMPLPFWLCKNCDNLEIIGGRKELKHKAVEGFRQLKELHRPWIDKVKLKCKCGSKMERIPEIGDVWLDAAVVYFSTLDYLDKRKYWRKWFPADFVTEGHEQIKLWFYATLFVAVTLENKTPYKSILTNGMVLDETGKEMHKSWGNVIWADEGLRKMGADVMRWMYSLQNPSLSILFGYTPAKEARRTLNVLFNTTNYLQTYWEANKIKKSKIKLDMASKWIISRLNSVNKNVTNYLEDLKPHLAAKELQNFFLEDLSRWYGHIIREDIKPEIKSKNKKSYLQTFYFVMLESLKLLSPFIPFLTENIYQNLFRKYERAESIHLMDWPKLNRKLINRKLERHMQITRNIVELANSKRHEAEIKLKYPLKSLEIKGGKEFCNAAKSTREIIRKLANVKEIRIKKSKTKEVKLNTEVDSKLKEEWLIRELIRGVQEKRKELGFNISDKVTLYLPEDKAFKKWKETIEKSTSSKIVFGGVGGKRESFVFEGESFIFGVK